MNSVLFHKRYDHIYYIYAIAHSLEFTALLLNRAVCDCCAEIFKFFVSIEKISVSFN